MEKDLIFHAPSSRRSLGDILLEHLIMSVFGFIGGVVLIIYGPLLLPDEPDAFHEMVMDFYTYQKPILMVPLGIGMAILSNIYLVWKNNRTNQLSSIHLEKGQYIFTFENILKNREKSLRFPSEEVKARSTYNFPLGLGGRPAIKFSTIYDKKIGYLNWDHVPAIYKRTYIQELVTYFPELSLLENF